MNKMKLSDIFSLYDLAIIKDTNGDYYVKDNADFLYNLKTWTYAGNNLLSVIGMIPDYLIDSEIDDKYADVEGKLTLLRAIADPEKYIEDDIEQQFITKERYEKYPDFWFNFTDIGQGVRYKANISGYNWKDIPDNAILYIPEYYIGTCEDNAEDVYTKADLEKCINDRVMDSGHFIDAETMLDKLSWETPESFLNGLDFEYKADTHDFDLD